jgi:hypothetical protein
MARLVSDKQLKAARVLAGLTCAQLCAEAGFGLRAAKYWESRGDNPPTSVPQSVERIVQVLLNHGVEVFCDPSPGLPRRLYQIDPGGIIGPAHEPHHCRELIQYRFSCPASHHYFALEGEVCPLRPPRTGHGD